MNPDVLYFPREKIIEAAEKFESPFFVYEEKRIRDNCRRFKGAFVKYFPDFNPLFAVKTNPNPAVLKIIMEEGFGMDASSKAESWISKKLGAEGMYTGNYTPAEELKIAKESGLILNLDDLSMVEFLPQIGVPEVLSFRINPGVGAGAMESLVVAGPDAKYGVPHEKAVEAYSKAREAGVKRFGIHMMTGSNVNEEEYFAGVVEKLLVVVALLKKEADIEIEFMNIGGGFGVPYRPEEKTLDLDRVAGEIRRVFDEQCAKHGLKEPQLMAEPGRLIVADAGWLIGRVQVIKESYKKFIGINASSNDMPRPSIYGAYHHVSVVNFENGKAVETASELEKVSVVGQICENSDQFAKDRELPKCKIGDLVVIHNSGGHAYAMGHNYNGHPRHAEYLLELNGDLRKIRRAETLEDLYQTVIF